MSSNRKSPRARLLAEYHAGAKRLYPDDETRREALDQLVQQRSAADCTDAQLRRACADLRRRGAQDQRRSGTGPGRPTPSQWDRLAAAARDLGWDGIDDKRTQGMCERTTGLASTRLLTTETISKLVLGLERMHRQSKPQEAKA